MASTNENVSGPPCPEVDSRRSRSSGRLRVAVMLLLLLPIVIGLYCVALMRCGEFKRYFVSEDESTLATLRYAQTHGTPYGSALDVWDINTGRHKRRVVDIRISSTNAMGLSDTGKLFLTHADGTEYSIFDLTLPTPTVTQTVTLPGDKTYGVRWVDDDTRLLFKDKNDLRIHDLTTDVGVSFGKQEVGSAASLLNDKYVARWSDPIRIYRRDHDKLSLVESTDGDLFGKVVPLNQETPHFASVLIDKETLFLRDLRQGGFAPRLRSSDSHLDASTGGKIARYYFSYREPGIRSSRYTRGVEIYEGLTGKVVTSIQFDDGPNSFGQVLGKRNEFLRIEREGDIRVYKSNNDVRIIGFDELKRMRTWAGIVVFAAIVWWSMWVIGCRFGKTYRTGIDVVLLYALVMGASGVRMLTNPRQYSWIYNDAGAAIFIGAGISAIAMVSLWIVFGSTRHSLRLEAIIFGTVVTFASVGYVSTQANRSVSNIALYSAISLATTMCVLMVAKRCGARFISSDGKSLLVSANRRFVLRDLFVVIVGFAMLFAIIRHQRFDAIKWASIMDSIAQVVIISVIACIAIWSVLGKSRWRVRLIVLLVSLPIARLITKVTGEIRIYDDWHWYGLFFTMLFTVLLSCLTLRINGIRWGTLKPSCDTQSLPS